MTIKSMANTNMVLENIKNMASVNILIRKGYLVAGVVMAANMFAVNEVKAMDENNKEEFKRVNQEGNKEGEETKDVEKVEEEINTSKEEKKTDIMVNINDISDKHIGEKKLIYIKEDKENEERTEKVMDITARCNNYLDLYNNIKTAEMEKTELLDQKLKILSDYTKKNTAYKASVRELENIKAAKEEAKTSFGKACEDTYNLLDAKARERNNLTSKILLQQKIVEDEQKKINNWLIKNQNLQNELDSLPDSIPQVQNDKGPITGDVDKEKVDKKQADIKSEQAILNRDIQISTQSIGKANAEIEGLRKDVEASKKEIDDLNNICNDAKLGLGIARQNDEKEEKNSNENEINEDEEKGKSTEFVVQEKPNWSSEFVPTKDHNGKDEEYRDNLRNLISVFEEQHDKLQKDFDATNTQVNDFKSQKNQLQDQDSLKKIEEAISNGEAKLQQQSTSLDFIQTKINLCGNILSLDKNGTEYGILSFKYDEQKEKNAPLQSEVKKLRQDFNTIARQLRANKQQINKEKKQADECYKVIVKSETELNIFISQYNDLVLKYKNLNTKYFDMKYYLLLAAKPLGSLLWSFANSVYHFENIELNKVYFFGYVPCVGYRWQPEFMKETGLFFDININIVSVLYGALITKNKYDRARARHEEEGITFWKWLSANIFFYALPNSLNFNLNIKIKDSYIAINLAGFIAELIGMLVSNVGIKKAEEHDDSEKEPKITDEGLGLKKESAGFEKETKIEIKNLNLGKDSKTIEKINENPNEINTSSSKQMRKSSANFNTLEKSVNNMFADKFNMQ